MNTIHLFRSKLVMAVAIACTVAANSASADIQSPNRGRIKRELRQLARVETKSRSNTNFGGGWTGTFQLARTNCSRLPQQIRFQHVITISGNRVRIVTNHDNTFQGTSRDKGRRLETVRQYNQNGGLVTLAIVYSSLKGDSARVGFAIDLRFPAGSCQAVYQGLSNRVF
jgi:hypothetical protein